MTMFENKVAIVTGGASGLGRTLGEALARRGALVVLADINSEGANQAARSICDAGYKASAETVDVTDFEAVKKLVDTTFREHGRLDYLFNNAGILIFGEARDCSIEDWRSVIDLDLYGVVNGVVAAFPLMVEQGFGHIVNTASVEGLAPFPVMGSYVASKYGVVGLSHALRAEGAALGVKVSVACPGYVTTKIIETSRMVRIDREKILASLTDSMGVSPEACVSGILRGVERNKATIVVGWWAKILWRMQRWSPGLVYWIMRMVTSQMRKSRIPNGQ
jgi:NAD(P)-dependent dehydrogenase (short-subunit alcohol dehydrogenase family)